jgi:uncharacterized protein YqeY
MGTISLEERVNADLTQAMRDQDQVSKLTLRAVKTRLSEVRKQNDNQPLDDAQAMMVIQKEAKQRRDAIVEYEKVGSNERVEEELAELAVLEGYLPQQLSEVEIALIVDETIAELGATSMRDMGQVMSAVMPKTSGQADGKVVNQIVRQRLQ